MRESIVIALEISRSNSIFQLTNLIVVGNKKEIHIIFL